MTPEHAPEVPLTATERSEPLLVPPRAEQTFLDVPPRRRPRGWVARAGAWLVGEPPRRVVVAPRARGQVLAARWAGRARAQVGLLDGARLGMQLVERLRIEEPDEVVFDLSAEIDEQVLVRAGARLLMDGARVHFVLAEADGPPVRARLARVAGGMALTLDPVSDGRLAAGARRAIDVVGSSVLLLAGSPVLLAVALCVWVSMGRPIIHVQQRVGRRGRLFPLYKFRSMVADAEAALRRSPEIYRRYAASDFKLPVHEDRRVTPLGRFLRRMSLDELPQLWNVLRGDMSLVGPRAIVPDEVARYGEYGRMLLRIKPGLTGQWQVTGRSTISYPERARIDLHYVAGRTLRQDLRILWNTLPAVLRQRGAL